ncbi:MAG: sigma-54 dependent transcriptional regulator [Treponemataceae bacterium]
MKFKILVIDDEKNIREGLQIALEDEGYDVITAADGDDGLKKALSDEIDLIITDLRMPGRSGEEVLKEVVSKMPGIPVVVLTGHGTIETAVDAMRLGAYDFLTKPLDLDHLLLLVKRALKNRELVLQHRQLEQELNKARATKNVVVKSPVMEDLMKLVKKVAPSRASVLVTGESGVGKEIIADTLHNLSERYDKPLVKVHCAALSETLLESELFGHEKGAFTGAVSTRRGRFELAHGGTIFLDEIGEIDQNVQIKLLRVIQEKKFERVGGEKTINVDVRIVAATNRNLKEEVEKGNFREDLFYRLNVVHIDVPPLRERKEDIPLLVHSFLKEFSAENEKQMMGLEQKAWNAIYNYDWPGNIRELKNCIESAVVISSENIIKLSDLPDSVTKLAEEKNLCFPIGTSLAAVEEKLILQTLAWLDGNKTKTAEVLGIGRKTLHRKLEGFADKHLQQKS